MSPEFSIVTVGLTWSTAGGASTSLKVLQPAKPNSATPTSQANRLAELGQRWVSDEVIKAVASLSLIRRRGRRAAASAAGASGGALLFRRDAFTHRRIRQADFRHRVRMSGAPAVPLQDLLHVLAVGDDAPIVDATRPWRRNM